MFSCATSCRTTRLSLHESGVEIAAVVEGLLQAAVLVIDNEVEVFAAMTVIQEGRGSFADALIGALGKRAGCSRTLTFDRKALRLPDFAQV